MPRISAQSREALTEERKEQILTAAARVFSRKGFERATIAEIAHEAGVSEGSIYNYFQNKLDLLVCIPQQIVLPAAHTLVAEVFQPATATPPSPEVVLTRIARNMIAIVRQNTDLFRVLLSTLPTADRALQEKYLATVPIYLVGMLETYVQAQMQAGIFRSDLNPTAVARAFPGMMILTLLIQDLVQSPNLSRLSDDEVITTVVRLFLHGLLADGSGASPTNAPAPDSQTS